MMLLSMCAQKNFKLLVEAFRRAEFSVSEINELLQLLAGLLHLSNATFVKRKGDFLELQDQDSEEAIKKAGSLLGIDVHQLEESLRCRHMLLKEDVLFTCRNEQQSISVRCSLIKFIYSRLFGYIVQRLNDSAARYMGESEKHPKKGYEHRKTIGSE